MRFIYRKSQEWVWKKRRNCSGELGAVNKRVHKVPAHVAHTIIHEAPNDDRRGACGLLLNRAPAEEIASRLSISIDTVRREEDLREADSFIVARQFPSLARQ